MHTHTHFPRLTFSLGVTVLAVQSSCRQCYEWSTRHHIQLDMTLRGGSLSSSSTKSPVFKVLVTWPLQGTSARAGERWKWCADGCKDRNKICCSLRFIMAFREHLEEKTREIGDEMWNFVSFWKGLTVPWLINSGVFACFFSKKAIFSRLYNWVQTTIRILMTLFACFLTNLRKINRTKVRKRKPHFPFGMFVARF